MSSDAEGTAAPRALRGGEGHLHPISAHDPLIGAHSVWAGPCVVPTSDGVGFANLTAASALLTAASACEDRGKQRKTWYLPC